MYNVFEGREKVLNTFESKIFLIKSKGSGLLNTDRSKLKILTSKQMLQRLPIALAQVKYESKQITKNVYNNIIKSI